VRTALLFAAVAVALLSATSATAKDKPLIDTAEQTCLAEALYYEAGGEGTAGMKAVAEVIIRRTQTSYYPGTVCGVVFQGADIGRCAFSFTCDDMRIEMRDPALWSRCLKLAGQVMRDRKALLARNATKGATHFHNDRITTDWRDRGLVRTAKIGRHIFYRDPTLRTASR
jgi:spore germination cell wall hydrolase CwlJ-like protein